MLVGEGFCDDMRLHEGRVLLSSQAATQSSIITTQGHRDGSSQIPSPMDGHIPLVEPPSAEPSAGSAGTRASSDTMTTVPEEDSESQPTSVYQCTARGGL